MLRYTHNLLELEFISFVFPSLIIKKNTSEVFKSDSTLQHILLKNFFS